MFHYVYVLKNRDNELYVGYTVNLKKRLEEHNRKKSFSTQFGAPWQMIFCEAFLNKKDAMRREKYLKTNQGARLLKRMLKEYLYETKKSKN